MINLGLERGTAQRPLFFSRLMCPRIVLYKVGGGKLKEEKEKHKEHIALSLLEHQEGYKSK